MPFRHKKRLSSSSSSFCSPCCTASQTGWCPRLALSCPQCARTFDRSELTSRIHVRMYTHVYINIYNIQDTYPHTQYWFQYYYFQNCAKVYNSYINGLARDLNFFFLYFTSLHSYWWWCRSDELPTKVSVCQYILYAGQTKCCYAMKLSLSLSVCECMRERERKEGSVPYHDPQVFWTVFEFFLFTLFCGCPLYCLLLLLSLCRHKRQQLSSLKHKNIFRKKNSFKYQTKTCSLNRKK